MKKIDIVFIFGFGIALLATLILKASVVRFIAPVWLLAFVIYWSYLYLNRKEKE